MNIGLGLLVEVVAFLAAAYVVVEMRPRLPQQTTDLVLGSIGCAMGAGALLFQQDVSLVGGVLAPLLAAVLLVGHVRALDVVGVRIPAWVQIPTSARRRAYAIDPAETQMIEEPVQQPRSATEPSRHRGSIPIPLPVTSPSPARRSSRLRSARSPPDPAWPSTVVRPPVETRLPRRGVRRTRVEVRRVGPFSVLKFSLIFYFCVFLVVYLSLAIIWGDPVRERRDRLAGAAARRRSSRPALPSHPPASSAPAQPRPSRSSRGSSSRGSSSGVASGS